MQHPQPKDTFLRLTVHKLAKAFGLSGETIRFYERKGLITSKRSHNGYRVFDHTAIQRIGNIKRLQNHSFTLEEIEKLNQQTNLQSVLKSYEEKQQQLEKKAKKINRMVQYNQWILDFAKMPCQQPILTTIPAHFFKMYPSFSCFWHDALLDDRIATLLNLMPICSFTTKVSIHPPTYRQLKRGLLIAESDVDLFSLNLSDDFVHIPEQSGLMALFYLKENDLIISDLLAPFDEVIQRNHYRSCGDLFTRQLICHATPENEFHHYILAYYPVETGADIG